MILRRFTDSPREKVSRSHEKRFVSLTLEKKRILIQLRSKAFHVIRAIQTQGNFRAIVHGSIARGDVDKHSDVDISILDPISTFSIEYALDSSLQKIGIIGKRISMATPNHAVKGHLILDNGAELTIPLCSLKQREIDFYKFSGFLTLNELEDEKQLIRVCGVNKRLLFIEPTEKGHWETSILGKENEAARVARKLQIDIDVVKERVRVLSRRDQRGRTGQFISRKVPADSHFESILKELQDRNPAVRRRLKN
ncbi:MAG: nucleotidyltransferase domain-containing protein [Candidatus Thorarchaeota archaeon]